MEIINNYIKSHFEDSIAVKNQILNDKSLIELIQEVAIKVTNAYKNANKTLLAGNGGSAADG
jgi:D-sedoheptulose 7-phosphate isomerase